MRKIKPSKIRFAKLLNEKSEQIFKDLKVDQLGTDSLAGWFLGPKAENADLLKKLINQALEQHIEDREQLYPNDPVYVTPAMKETEEYQRTVQVLEEKATALFEQLKGSVPFWSIVGNRT